MKKITFSIFVFFICIITVCAEKIDVKFSDCVDGDTAKFIYNNKKITARFLAIDCPETNHPTKKVEPLGKEASEYTCNRLKNAKKISLEFDEESDTKDKYDRYLVWVFVDGDLLQKELVSNGLADVAYLYGDYKYTNILKEAEKNKKNVVSSKETQEKMTIDIFVDKYKEYIILFGIIIIYCIFSVKGRKRVKRKIKRKIIRKLNKKDLF